MSEQSQVRILRAQLGHILRHGQTVYLTMTAAQCLMVFGLWPNYSHTIPRGIFSCEPRIQEWPLRQKSRPRLCGYDSGLNLSLI